MSNPIKSLLPTPLSMEVISNINALSKLPLPLYKFFIDSAFSIRSTIISQKDQQFLGKILQRQRINSDIGNQSINAVKLLQRVAGRVIKLMKTSQPEQIQSNIQNCTKYIGTVLSENTLTNQIQIGYLTQKLSSFITKFLQKSSKSINTKAGTVEWAIYNLKKANMNVSNQQTKQKSQKQNSSQISNIHEENLKTINKMYVKVSFEQNFDFSQIQNLIGSGFQTNKAGTIQSKIQHHQNPQNTQSNTITSVRPKTITMSLIDFKIFMGEIQKIKNFNS